MATEVSTYDPQQVSIIVGGAIMHGFAPDTFVTVARNNDMWNTTVGCDGVVARAKTNDYTGKVTITLMHTSPSNDVLSAFAAADELSNSGTVPIIIKDNQGNTLCSALTSWITKPADVERGNTVSNNQWVIATGRLDMVVGGNTA